MAQQKATEAVKSTKKGSLPEGYVTPVEFAKVLTERKLHTSRNGEHYVRPQMVYSYMKNASGTEHEFPIEIVKDSNEQKRQALKLEAGIEWWTKKNERVEQRKQNAAAREAEKSAKIDES